LAKKRAAYKKNPKKYLKINKKSAPKYTRAIYFERLRKAYGLSQQDYEQMCEVQEDRCAICGERPRKERDFCVDHDHVTGKVRGLLCRRCNLGLGNLRDDPMLLRQAAAYLEQARGQDDAKGS